MINLILMLEIEILNNGNLIKGIKKGKITSDNGIVILLIISNTTK